jgi:hypothetical protein
MKAAGDVGAGDDVQQGLVIGHAPEPEALAEIGVEVDGHRPSVPRTRA